MPQLILSFDPLALISETRFNAVSAILVAERLARTAPEDMTPDEKKALKDMVAAAARVEHVREERATRQPARVKPFVLRFNAAWGGVSDILAAAAGLPVSIAASKVERAQKMRDFLFPESGAPTLNGDAETSYVDGHERLVRVDENGMKKELAALVGAEHMEALVVTTRDLGEALGVGETARVVPSTTAMAEALREATRTVSVYGRKLVGHLDEQSEESVKRFTDALGPLIDYKASISRAGGSADDEEDAPPAEPPKTPPSTPAAPAAPSGA